MNYLKYFFIGLILICTACKKDTQPSVNPPISNVPSIEFVEAIPTTVKQFSDSIKFTIKFTDGDGDLGDISADSLSLYLYDSRSAAIVERFHIVPVAPSSSSLVVQGQFSIMLGHTILLNNTSASESAVFSFMIKDRAGNKSNMVQSGSITIVK
ncbi:MAG: hypothetical protein RIQ33_2450 [Bacteroidota bacterium]|jgi:hypothetical protein